MQHAIKMQNQWLGSNERNSFINFSLAPYLAMAVVPLAAAVAVKGDLASWFPRKSVTTFPTAYGLIPAGSLQKQVQSF